nr:MAG TPA: Protein of unknown function (DUF551) [Caudoviricetes sp.]
MPMRDYEDLKNLKIPAEQERIMDIICDVWEECRATDCQSECKDNQVLPCEHTLFACTALRYSRRIIESGYAPAKWIDVNDRLPETSDDALVVLAHTYDDSFHDYGIARYILSDDGAHWADSKHGYLEWDRYSDGHGGSSSYKVIAWMPIPKYRKEK